MQKILKHGKLITEIKSLTSANSDEVTILTSLVLVNNELSPTFPSRLRNRVNYQLKYGLMYVNNKLYRLNHNLSWLHEILAFDAARVSCDDNKICNIYLAYSKYIEVFIDKMICDYYDILGTENGVVKSLNKKQPNSFKVIQHPFDFQV